MSDNKISDIKVNQNGMTKLLVKIHIDDRIRLVAASEFSGSSQQALIRNGIALILDSILAHAPAKKSTPAKKTTKPAPKTRKVVTA
jgi:hypothetical protein